MRSRLAIVFAIVIAAMLAMMLAGCGSGGGYKSVSAEEAKQLMDTQTDYVILDVRTAEEYAEKHIPGAVLLPDTELKARAEIVLPKKKQLILVYCRSGNRSKTASETLVQLGYTNVVEFGGINEWPYEVE